MRAYYGLGAASRRYIVWTEIVVLFVLLELALWAPHREMRNLWAVAAAIAMDIFIIVDLLIGRTSIRSLGLRLPTVFGGVVVLTIGLATTFLIFFVVNWADGQIPANPSWFPDWRSIWGYVLWALLQEFILLSFFFNRLEELLGSSSAVWTASALFAAVHLPSPVLTTFTLVGALFFGEMFRRYRSIYPIAVVHAMLGLTIGLVVPDTLLHHMRVGIGYLRY